MDPETLKTTIINYAAKDIFDGVGRVFLNEFTKTFNVTIEEVLAALKESGYEHRIVNENILLLTFTLKQPQPFIFKEGAPRIPQEE